LISGLGSIGRRHLRNLRILDKPNIILHRTGRSTLPDDESFGLPVTHDLQAALAERPLGVIVANPTALHMPVAIAAAQADCHLLVEKPISHNLGGIEELRREIETRSLRALIGFQFRFHPGLREIKTWLDSQAIGRVISAQAHWGEYLPDWHPWENYRNSYSARSELGGGVTLTLCHPFDYLRWLLGEVESVSAMTQERAGLETDVEEAVQATLRFVSGAIGNVYLDYLERPRAHWLWIVGEKGTIRWDESDGTAHLYDVAIGKWRSFAPPQGFERNTMFLDEMRHFLNCIAGHDEPVCTIEDGMRALQIALAAKRSAAEKREIDV